MTNLEKNLILLTSLLSFLLIFSFLFPSKELNNQQAVIVQIPTRDHEAQEEPTPPKLKAQSACVFDSIKNKSLFNLNATAQLPLASLTKLMTAVIAKEYLPEFILVKISREAIKKDGDMGLIVGENWKLQDIIDVMLISSSNDAAFAIANTFPEFITHMNQKAQQMDLFQTHFLNVSGLDISNSTAGAYGSCEDITKLIKYIIENHPNLLEATTQDEICFDDRCFKNTNKISSKLPSFIAGKTGFDDLAGGNLVVVVDKGLNHPIIITVLGSTREDRFTDVEKLYQSYILH